MNKINDPKLVSQAKKKLKLSFRQPRLLESSLFHPSYRNENVLGTLEDFDRLEFFGDSILNYVICRKLYRDFPDANEGVLSRLRSILVSRKILARITRSMQLHRLIKVGKSLRALPIDSKSKIFADSFESLIAALFFDKGLKATESFILEHFTGYFDSKKLLRLDPNPKSTLQELSQKMWQKLPLYQYRQTSAGIHVTVSIGKIRKTTVLAQNRRHGEEQAARLLIQKIRQEVEAKSKRVSSGKKLRKTL